MSDLVRRFALEANIPFRAEVTTPGGRLMRALASQRGWPRPDLDAEIAGAREDFERAHVSAS